MKPYQYTNTISEMIRLITEELHSFNTQYSLAQELTNIVINMLHSNVVNYTHLKEGAS